MLGQKYNFACWNAWLMKSIWLHHLPVLLALAGNCLCRGMASAVVYCKNRNLLMTPLRAPGDCGTCMVKSSLMSFDHWLTWIQVKIKAVFPIKIRKLKHYHHCKYNQNCDKWIILSVSVSVCIFLCWAVYLDLSCVSHIFHPSPRITTMFSTCVWLTPPPFHVAYKLMRVSCGQSFAFVFTGRVCVICFNISQSVWYLWFASCELISNNQSSHIAAPAALSFSLCNGVMRQYFHSDKDCRPSPHLQPPCATTVILVPL